jgi:hypothetical protein
MARKTNRNTSKLSSCAGSTRACVRALARTMNPNACDYGAGGAALFDIVKVHFGRGAEPRRTHKVASTPGAAPRSVCRFLSWLSSSGRALTS